MYPPAPLRWLSGGGGTSRPRALSPARPRLSPLPGALTPFHYCTARCDRDSSATGKEGQPGRWSQQLRRLPGWGHEGRARAGWEDPGFVPELADSRWNDAGGGQLGEGALNRGQRQPYSGEAAGTAPQYGPGPCRDPAGPGPEAAAAPPRPDPALSPLPPPLSLGP